MNTARAVLAVLIAAGGYGVIPGPLVSSAPQAVAHAMAVYGVAAIPTPWAFHFLGLPWRFACSCCPVPYDSSFPSVDCRGSAGVTETPMSFPCSSLVRVLLFTVMCGRIILIGRMCFCGASSGHHTS